jgi:DNA-binding XRE family transcriptional regulator
MARTANPRIDAQDKTVIGGLLRELRRAAGYRSVEAAASTARCPASRQTIYAYERGSLVPSLAQFLALTEFYVLHAPRSGGKSPDDLRAQGVAAVARVLTVPAYHVAQAYDLMARMQPDPRTSR